MRSLARFRRRCPRLRVWRAVSLHAPAIPFKIKFVPPMESMNCITRRVALTFGLVGWVAMQAGCGGSGESSPSQAASPPARAPTPSPAPTPAPSPSPPPQEAWNVGSVYFAVGGGATLNLNTTLPRGVVTGGVFGISPEGAALPAGMSLSAAGILAIGSAVVGQVTGVIFTYAEPST